MYVTTSLESLGWPAVCLSSEPAGRPSECCKDFNVAIFSDTVNMTKAKLCITVLLVRVVQVRIQSSSHLVRFLPTWTRHVYNVMTLFI